MRVLADDEIIKAFKLFLEIDWQIVDDYKINHFGTRCRQVLTIFNWGFFTPEDTEESLCKCNTLKFRFRHLLNCGSVLTAEMHFPLDMEYPEFT